VEIKLYLKRSGEESKPATKTRKKSQIAPQRRKKGRGVRGGGERENVIVKEKTQHPVESSQTKKTSFVNGEFGKNKTKKMKLVLGWRRAEKSKKERETNGTKASSKNW